MRSFPVALATVSLVVGVTPTPPADDKNLRKEGGLQCGGATRRVMNVGVHVELLEGRCAGSAHDPTGKMRPATPGG
jgi:hypothetical protein